MQDLGKYEYLLRLKASDETLFYAVLVSHTAELVPLVYTPTVGRACVEFSHLLVPRGGLFISLEDRGRVDELLSHWPERDVRAIVVTDGERILGLGDLGANGLPISVGKLALYCALGGVTPRHTLPVLLDMGTNNERNLADPLYIGLRRRRAAPGSPELDGLVEEFVTAVQARYGAGCLIQWEDWGNENAFRLLHKYQPRAVTFNDDVQGTASVVVAALMGATRITGTSLGAGEYLFFGAGEAGTGIADLLAYAISLETGCTVDEARKHIWLVDSQGLVVASRKSEGRGLAHHKLPYAHDAPAISGDLRSIVAARKPTALIGVSTQPGTFTQGVVAEMCAHNARPVIFALSNPTSKSECTAEQAYTWSKGAAVFASGSPFDPVLLDGKRVVPAQANNSYIFPAVGLATIAARISSITDHTMYVAAKALAGTVTEADVAVGSVLPADMRQIRDVSAVVSAAIVDDAYSRGIAGVQPRPANTLEFVKAAMWKPEYADISARM